MTDREIYNKYMNMVGDDPHKIRVLKDLTAKSGKALREIIEQQRAIKAEPEKNEELFTKTEDKKEALSAAVFNAITEKLEALDVSIKFLESKIYADQEHKKKLEEEYKELSEFLRKGEKIA